MKRALLVAALLLLTATAVARSPVGDPRSTLVYPEQHLPITFSHSKHLELGLQCQVCHVAATTSTDARDSLVPGHPQCNICHLTQAPDAVERYPKAGCGACHTAIDGGTHADVDPMGQPLPTAPQPERIDIPPARITFSHKLHVDLGTPCLECHVGVDSADLATRQHLPTMRTCLDCHTGGAAPSECTTCHLQGDGGRLLTMLDSRGRLRPSGQFRPDDHDQGRWLEVHRAAARTDEASCGACHDADSCLDCHDGLQEPIGLHPADWKNTHGLEAQRRTLDCLACHEVEADCRSCHAEAGVTPSGFPSPENLDNPGDLTFHPNGWRGEPGTIPTGEHHSFQARRSLETCVACHGGEGESLCLECHGALVSPHPDAWAEDVGTWRFGQGEGTVCLRCHLPGDPVLAPLNR